MLLSNVFLVVCPSLSGPPLRHQCAMLSAVPRGSPPATWAPAVAASSLLWRPSVPALPGLTIPSGPLFCAALLVLSCISPLSFRQPGPPLASQLSCSASKFTARHSAQCQPFCVTVPGALHPQHLWGRWISCAGTNILSSTWPTSGGNGGSACRTACRSRPKVRSGCGVGEGAVPLFA